MSMTPLDTPIVSGLTSAHRCLMARIQDLCLDLTLNRGDVVASCHYNGISHDLTVRITPRAQLSRQSGGDGSFMACEHILIYLPGSASGGSSDYALCELASAIETLEGYLPAPGGAA